MNVQAILKMNVYTKYEENHIKSAITKMWKRARVFKVF